MTITGECFCGEVTYQVNGLLRDARSCHCSRCRKAFSSQASVYALVEPQDFSWLSGDRLLTTYVGSKATWEVIPDGVLQYQEDVPEQA